MFGATIETRRPGACEGRSVELGRERLHASVVDVRCSLHRHESAYPTVAPERRAVDLVSEQSHVPLRAGTR